MATARVAGWLFVTPAIVIVGLFVLVPVVMAAWVSMSDWSGIGPPFAEGVNFVGIDNYAELLGGTGLATRDLGTALRNNLFYVLLVVPIQTAVALWLAILVNRRVMRGRGFFRTAFYFPSVTSSVAIVVLWLFLFSATGPVNKVLSWIAIDGPNWFEDPRGVFHIVLGAFGVTAQDNPLAGVTILGITAGTGSPARRSPCRPSSSWRSSPPRARSCSSSSRPSSRSTPRWRRRR